MDFQVFFSSESACWERLVGLRWPRGIRCLKCPDQKQDFIRKRKVFECRGCGKQRSATAGTMFHKSRIPLKKWFWTIFLMATSKKGASMLYLQKQLGLKSYRSAWLMGHKIRSAMLQRDEAYSLQGIVEADEIFIGGKRNRETLRRTGTNKTPFLMAVEERDANRPRFLKVQELEDITLNSVVPAVEKLVQKGSKLKTDGAIAYRQAQKKGYDLEQSSYFQDPAKTQEHLKWVNTLTSNLKRFLLSTYHGVYPKYRKAYLAEFAYRFNRRYWPRQAFDRLLFACINARAMTLPELKA